LISEPRPSDDDPQGVQPLRGLRVIELSSWIAGAYAGTILADFGAEVVKIEQPGSGDAMRAIGKDAGDGRRLPWLSIARNKRSVTLDLRNEAARPVLKRLIENADVVTENFRPGTLERWGIGWDWISATNPRVHLLRVSGFGQTGPYSSRTGFDRIGQAFSGIVHLTGEADGPPQRIGVSACDYITGLWGALGVLVAVEGLRSSGGKGQMIDLALYESLLPLLDEIPARYTLFGDVPERHGNLSRYVAPGGAYRTTDGRWLFVSATGDHAFAQLMRAVGRPDLAADPKLRSNSGRLPMREELDQVIGDYIQARNMEEVAARLEEFEVPFSAVNSVDQLMSDPHVQARKNFVEVEEAGLPALPVGAPVPKLSDTPGRVRWLGQELGACTEDVLHGVGYSDAEIESLRVAHVI